MLSCVGVGFHCVDYLLRITNMPSFEGPEHARVVEYSVQGGGPVSTALVTMAKLGAKVAYMGRVGDDDAGRFILDEYRRYGVDISHVKVERGGASPRDLVLVHAETGERAFIFFPFKLEFLKIEDVDEELIRNSKILLIDGCKGEAFIRACKLAKKAGSIVLMDGVPSKDLIGLVDIAIASDDWVRMALKAKTVQEALEKLFARGVEIAGITLGSEGSIFKTEEEVFRQRGFKVKVVDTTGAGDVFHGAFAYGIAEGWDIRKTAEFASAVAAIKCKRLGGRAGIPDLQEAINFLRKTGSPYF